MMIISVLLFMLLLNCKGVFGTEYECMTSCDIGGVVLELAVNAVSCCERQGVVGYRRAEGRLCMQCWDPNLLQPYIEEDVDWLYTDGGSGGLDECTINGCHTLATCQNMDGSMRCVCEPGYTGDGVICIDINECDVGSDDCDRRYYYVYILRHNHLLSIKTRGICINIQGGFLCSCQKGFKLKGTKCIDTDECISGDNSTCAANAVCLNTVGCHCPAGYEGDGYECCLTHTEIQQLREDRLLLHREMTRERTNRQPRKRTATREVTMSKQSSTRRMPLTRSSKSESTRYSTTSSTLSTTSHNTNSRRTSLSTSITTTPGITKGCRRYLSRQYTS